MSLMEDARMPRLKDKQLAQEAELQAARLVKVDEKKKEKKLKVKK